MRMQEFVFEETGVKNTEVKPYVLRSQKIGFEESEVKETGVKPYVL